jgi:hypothetical protein
MAEAAPASRAWVVVGAAQWDALLAAIHPHARALLEQGVFDWADADAGRDAIPDTNVTSLRRRARAAVEVARRGASGASASNRRGDPAGEGGPNAAERRSDARSLAEALLFAALQADARTAGLFALNADGGFEFGGRAAEIDLLCGSLGVAIEVDGYFHFQDTAAYRRDRAKDWLMQRRGLWVLRFLAEDVVDDLEAIVGRVAEAVALRRPTGGRGGNGGKTVR